MNRLREWALFYIYSIERLNKRFGHDIWGNWGLFKGQVSLGVMIAWLQLDILIIYLNIRGNLHALDDFHEFVKVLVGILIITFILDSLIYNRKRYQQACVRFESLGKQEKKRYVAAIWFFVFVFIGLTVIALRVWWSDVPFFPNQ